MTFHAGSTAKNNRRQAGAGRFLAIGLAADVMYGTMRDGSPPTRIL